MPKIQPAHLDLKFTVQTTEGNHSAIADIDLARCLSAVNRRLYRQGMMYYVTGVTVTVDPATVPIGTIVCSTAPDTWMTHNAWKKGYHLWRGQVNDALDALPGIEGKWADFKVSLDDASGTVLETVAKDNGTIVPDEWNHSNFVWDDDGTERSPVFNLLGASSITGNIGLIQEYHISRSQVTRAPEVNADASDSIYTKSLGTDEMTDTIVDFIEGENDDAPYDMTEMVGGDTVADAPFDVAYTAATYFNPVSTSRGFKVPCGLLRVQIGTFQATGAALTAGTAGLAFVVHLAAGGYKGAMAEPMGQ